MEHMQDEYIAGVIRELELRRSILENNKLKSIYIGGGTPTYLNLRNLEKLLGYLGRYVWSGIEYTCEANPGTLSLEKLSVMKRNGVNRLSIGLQSWDDRILKSLGRIHTLGFCGQL
jgi:oxygen-independent coproporphyrinogen-3 oxidase